MTVSRRVREIAASEGRSAGSESDMVRVEMLARRRVVYEAACSGTCCHTEQRLRAKSC
jgi:hypothetical protein